MSAPHRDILCSWLALRRLRWTLPPTNGKNEHKLGSCLVGILLPPSERAPSAPVPSTCMKTGLELI